MKLSVGKIRRIGLAIIACAAAVALSTIAIIRFTSSHGGAKTRPNIILISIDTLRADHLGCYDYGINTSPNLDRFARTDAVLFENTIAQAPSTQPSHASIFTSLLPSHHGSFFSRKTPLPGELKTMAEILKDNGYRTFSVNGGSQIAAEFGFDQGFDTYLSLKWGAKHQYFKKTVEHALKFILDKKTEKPFFAFLHTYETHHPYTPDGRFLDLIGHKYSGELSNSIYKKDLMLINEDLSSLSADDKRHIIALYDAEIRSMDEAFEELVKALQSGGYYQDSLIILTSDHGEEFGERTMMGWHSHALFNEQVRIPLIIKFPGNSFGGERVEAQVASMDILPTVLDILSIAPLPVFEGKSLWGLVNGSEEASRPAVSQRDMTQDDLPVSLQTPDWKYCYESELGISRLFHLKSDPSETVDVLEKEPQIAEKMKKQLKELLDARPTMENKTSVTIDEPLRKSLEALGYMN